MLDIFNKSNGPLAERARSPLYGSFVISWLIWNWRIVLTIFFFSKEDFKGLNLVQYISTTYLNTNDCLLIPLAFSFGYMLIVPWIDYFLVWHSEVNKRTKIDRKIAVGRSHSVEGNLYYDLRFKYDEEKKKILNFESELAAKQTDVNQAENELKKKEIIIKELQGEIAESATKKHEFERQVNILEKRHTLDKIFRGRWVYQGLEYNHNSGKIAAERDIYINSNRMYEVKNGEQKHLHDLDLIDVNEANMFLSFVKLPPNSEDKEIRSNIIVCKLTIIGDDLLEGKENNLKVTYRRRTFDTNSEQTNNHTVEL